MSDEKDTDTEDWRIDSLEEDDEIIDLTDEIVRPPQADASVDEEPDSEAVEIEELEITELEEEPLELTDAVDEEAGFEDLPALAAAKMTVSEEEADVDLAEVNDIGPFPDTPEADSDPESEWHEELAAELSEALTPADDEIIEISEFDQEYFSADEAAEAADGLTGPADAEDEDYLELIDIEEPEEDNAELDDDIIRFESEETEEESIVFEEVVPDHSYIELDNESAVSFDAGLPTGLGSAVSPDTSLEAADDHWLEDTADLTDLDRPTDGFTPGEKADLVPESGEAGAGATDDDLEVAADIPESHAAALGAVDPQQIEAAVARIIERDYSPKIESLVAAAIEKVVSGEIERLKSKLFQEGEDDTR